MSVIESPNKQVFQVQDVYSGPHGQLLEGTTYDERTDTFFYIDVKAGTVYAVANSTGSTKAAEDKIKAYKVSNTIGFVGLTTDVKKIICAVDLGITLLDLTTGETEQIAAYPNGNVVNGGQLRSNDGGIDKDGTLWIGTMEGGLHRRFGSMYLLKQKGGVLTELWNECFIPNGINWDEKNGVMYWTESGEHTIYKYDYDASNNHVYLDSKTKYFVDEKDPDGSCLDKDGNLYVAIYGSNKVIRITRKGEIDMEWKFPSQNITCCIFGDKDLSSLYVSCGNGAAEGDLGAAIFKIDLSQLGIKGVPSHKFIL